MLIVTRVEVTAQGYVPERITTEAAGSVEHLLVALQSGKFAVGRATSTHILDQKLVGTEVPAQFKRPRREGTVTVRTGGPSVGGVYIYRADVPSSPAHSVVGQVVHGIELVKLAKEGDDLSSRSSPRVSISSACLSKRQRRWRQTGGFPLRSTPKEQTGSSYRRNRGRRWMCSAEKSAKVTTAPFEQVIDIVLDDVRAPLKRLRGVPPDHRSCRPRCRA